MKVVAALVTLTGLIGTPVKADFLEDYFRDKIFGIRGGSYDENPCPVSEPCEGDAENIPTEIGNAQVCFLGQEPGSDFACAPLKDTIKAGTYSITNLVCEDLSVDDMNFNHVFQDEFLIGQLNAQNLRLTCDFDIDVENLVLEILGFVRITASFSDTKISFSNGRVNFAISTVFDFVTESAINTEVPESLDIPFDTCDISPDLNTDFNLPEDQYDYLEICLDILFRWRCLRSTSFLWNLVFSLLPMSQITAAIVNLLEGLIATIICQIITQSAWLDPPDNTEKGYLNLLWSNFTEDLEDAAASTADDLRLEDSDSQHLARYGSREYNPLTQAMLDGAVNFANSSTAEIVSVSLNNWLGAPTTEDTSGRLVINEVVDLLTTPTEGYLLTGDLTASAVEYAQEAGWADITVKLIRAQFYGLNTFTKFRVLQNGYEDNEDNTRSFDAYNRTFNNSVALETLGIQFEMEVVLEPGGWVAQTCADLGTCGSLPDDGSISFTFTFSMELKEVDFEFAFALVFDDVEYEGYKMGQLFQYDIFENSINGGSYFARVCLNRAIYALRLTSLEGSLTSIEDPVLLNFDGEELTDFIEGIIRFLTAATKGFFNTKFGGISQGPIRDYLNANLTWVVDDGYLNKVQDLCPPWTADIFEPPLQVDFDQGLASYAYPLINDALGGNPIVNTDSDINEFFDTLLKFYEVSIEDFPLDSWDNTTDPPTRFEQGYWELRDDLQDDGLLPAFNDPARFLFFTNVYADGLSSIYKLTATRVPREETVDEGLRVRLGVGGALRDPDPTMGNQTAQPLEFGFTFSAEDLVDRNLNEKWDFKLFMDEFDMEFVVNNVIWNVNNYYAITYPQAYFLPCTLQALEQILFPGFGRDSSIKTLSFTVERDPSSTSPASEPLRDALEMFRDGPQSSESNSIQLAKNITFARFQALINSFANGLFEYGLDEIEDIPIYYDEAEINRQNCDTKEDPLFSSGLPSITGFIPNGTYISEVCLAPLSPRPDVRQFVEPFENLPDGETVYNWEESDLIQILQNALTSGETVNDLLIGLANNTDGTFTDYLKLNDTDPNDIKVDLELQLSELGFLFESTRVLPGFIADTGLLQVRGINRFVRSTVVNIGDDQPDYSLFKPAADSVVVLQTKLEFTDDVPLDAKLFPKITVPKEFVGELGAGNVVEEIEMDLVIRGLRLEFDLVLAINERLFGNLTLAHMFTVDANQKIDVSTTWSECLLSAVFEDGIFIPYFGLQIDNMTGPTLASNFQLVSPGFEAVLNELVAIVKDFYFDAIPNLCDNCARTIINDRLKESWIEAQKPGTCPALEDIPTPPLQEENQFYKFNSAPDWLEFQTFFNDYVRTSAGDFAEFNEIIEVAYSEGFLVSDEGENIFFPEVPLVYDGEQYGVAGIGARDVMITPQRNELGGFEPFGGLGTFTDIRILEPYFWQEGPINTDALNRRRLVQVNDTTIPVETEDLPFMTFTKISHAGPVLIEGFYDLNFTDLFPEEPDMKNQLRVGINFKELEFKLEMLLKVNITKALTVRFSSISEYEELPCLFVPVAELEPLNFDFSVKELGLSIACVGTCDFFPRLENGGVLDTENTQEITALLNDFINFTVAYLDSRGAQTAIDTFLAAAESQCARILGIIEDALDVPDDPQINIAATFGIIFLGSAGLGGIMAGLLFPTHRRRREKLMARILARHKDISSEEELAGIMAITELTMKSTFAHPVTPIGAKFVVPVICLLNVVGLVIAIVFSDAANIVIAFTFLGFTTQQIKLVPFTIVSTINDIWNSGAWPLSVLIAVASCAWPVVKNLLLFMFWFLPKTLMSGKKQRAWLDFLDLLGKWSFLDVYVIVIMLAALRTYVTASYFSFGAVFEDDFFIADVNVSPETGIILLCFVASMSLVINHIIIFFHDRVEESNGISEDKINGNFVGKVPQRAAARRRMFEHIYVAKDAEGHARGVSKRAAVVILAVLAVAMLFNMIGVFLPFVTFEMKGLVGLLLEYINNNPGPDTEFLTQLNIKTYSIVDLGAQLSRSPAASVADRMVLVFFQFLFFLVTFIAPIFNVGMIAALFVIPMDLKTLNRVHFFTKLSFYWSALEVFTVGIVATIIEIEPVTAYIVDFITDDICGYIRGAISLLVEDEEDAFCLNVIGSFEPTAGVLIFGSLLQLLGFFVVTTISRTVRDDRYFAAYHDLRNDVKPKRLSRIERFVIRKCTFTFKAENEGLEGVSAFYNLDGSNLDGQVDPGDPTMIGRFCDWCCSTEKGTALADARIEAWQKRFGVVDRGGGDNSSVGGYFQSTSFNANPAMQQQQSQQVVSSNPVFSAMPSTSARVRSDSDDSVNV